MLQRGHSGDGCDLTSNLCKYDLKKGDLTIVNLIFTVCRKMSKFPTNITFVFTLGTLCIVHISTASSILKFTSMLMSSLMRLCLLQNFC